MYIYLDVCYFLLNFLVRVKNYEAKKLLWPFLKNTSSIIKINIIIKRVEEKLSLQ